jgi:ribonuclease P protein component
LGVKVTKLINYFFRSCSKLKSKNDFDNVFNTASFRKRTKDFSLLATKNNTNTNRLGIVVAKKRFKLAVTRNKLKRQVREIYRCQQEKLPGIDLIVIVNTLECDKKLLETLITKAGNYTWPKS